MKYIGKNFLHKSFDAENDYSVPYFWGTLGIVYNDKFVKKVQLKLGMIFGQRNIVIRSC